MEATNFTREQLAQYILTSAKDSVIDKFKSILVKEQIQSIVGYTVDGEALTIEMMNEKLELSEEDYKANRVTTDEELAKEIENW